MATELVDASKLDACCTAEANAIRAKTGSSAQIAYDWANSKGFADAIAAIQTGGGTNIQSGSFIPANNTRTFTVELTEAVTHFVFYNSDYPQGTADAGWHIVGGFWVNNSIFSRIRFNTANDAFTNAGAITINNNLLTVSNLTYDILAGKTIYWFAW